jgi:hypothetical protein
MKITTRYAALVEDPRYFPQQVWGTPPKRGESMPSPTPYGPASYGVWTDGWVLALFGDRERCADLVRKMRASGKNARLERWEYEPLLRTQARRFTEKPY